MDKLCNIILSESQEYDNTGGITSTKIVQPFLTLKSPILPSALSFYIMILVTGYNGGKLDKLIVKITDPNGDSIMEINQVNINVPNGFENFGFNLVVRNIVFNVPGVYKVECQINNDPYEEKFYIIDGRES